MTENKERGGMANRRLAKGFMDVAVESATSEAAEFPASNIVARVSPQRAWRSTTVAAAQRVVIDLGEARTDLTAYLDWVNFAAFKYQESADGVSGWADVGGERAVEMDPMHGVCRRVDGITLTSKRYLGIYIPAQPPVDGADYFRIGTFCAPVGVVELDAATWVEYPLEYAIPDSNVVVNQYPTGRSERIKLGIMPPMMISFALRTEALTNMRGPQVEEAAGLLRDTTATLFLDFNLGESWQAYLVKKTGELRASVSTPGVNTADFGTVLFEVVI